MYVFGNKLEDTILYEMQLVCKIKKMIKNGNWPVTATAGFINKLQVNMNIII